MEHDSCRKELNRVVAIDPRLSLVLAVAAIAAIFAANSWGQLALLACVSIALLVRLAVTGLFLRRLLWLRWFLLFVILLHVLLSPGHTLFGLAWLSYDGLLRGVQVSVQVVTALAASLVLTRLVPAKQLAGAAAQLLGPLAIIGVNVERFVEQILMALEFVPILREEVSVVSGQLPEPGGRVEKVRFMIAELSARLVARADRLAYAAASDKTRQPAIDKMPPLLPLAFTEWLVAGAALLVALVYFGMS